MDLWSWIKVRYDSSAKLYPIRRFYGDKIRSLKLKYGVSLVNYINLFQVLAVMWREIEMTIEPEYRLVAQMVEHI